MAHSVTSLVEHPFVTEAGGSEGEAVCQLGMLSLAALTGAQPSSPLGHEGLVHKALLLLVGIPSDIFPYDPVLRKFSIQGGARLKGTSSEALSASLCCFLQCGRDIRFLEDLVSSDVKPTLTWQAFVGALRHFLHYFHGCLLPMAGRADTLTILQLTHIVSSLCNSVRCITDICRSAVQVQEVASQRQQSMLLLRHLCQCARSCWGQEASSLVAFLLRQSCRPYLRFLEEWLYGGCCNDPYEEFPLVVHKQEVEMRDERFWEKGFQYAASEAPFLAPFMPQVFTSAKSAMLLKVCKPQSGLLWSKQLRPELRLSFSSRQLAQARELSERYGRLMESELQLLPLPKFRLGLDPHINTLVASRRCAADDDDDVEVACLFVKEEHAQCRGLKKEKGKKTESIKPARDKGRRCARSSLGPKFGVQLSTTQLAGRHSRHLSATEPPNFSSPFANGIESLAIGSHADVSCYRIVSARAAGKRRPTVLLLKEAICLELATSETTLPNLGPQEWKAVAGLVKALEPIASATKDLRQDEQKYYVLATACDPRFKDLSCTETFQETRLLELARTQLQLPPEEESSDCVEASTSRAHKERVSSIWDSIEKLAASSERRHSPETANIEELKRYLLGVLLSLFKQL
ncbi:hypothetical protein HPB52_009569 [Rhipicephalus sanguineus]|uniref:Gamma-tubulin complex component n=1 Tax=Rhipicephalus sanguineus TaxID=34632 RepID=A0A9D4T614_RHISA|nr:hypothetical protein HPB52_009569 [Rhipicephalus sanguineus]